MPQTNKTLIVVALITIIPSTIAAIGSWKATEAASDAHDAIVATKAIVVPLAATVEKVQEQTNGMQAALTAATLKVGEAKGEAKGVQKGIVVEKARAATAKENQAKGAATEKSKPFWKQ